MTNVFDGERVHVMAKRCSTCIFRKGNLMQLEEGRVEDMIDTAMENDGVIPCHQTIHGDRMQEAVCRGFYEHALQHSHLPLELATAMHLIQED